MSAILLDNWTIESALANLYSDKEELFHKNEIAILNSAWVNFLIAIVLWDEIWYIPNITSFSWQGKLANFKAHCKVSEFKYFYDAFSSLEGIIHPINLNDYFDQSDEFFGHKIMDFGYDTITNIDKKAEFYLLMSNALSLNYFPHTKRQAYVNKFIEDSRFSRKEITDYIDKQLYEFYEKINIELGRKFVTFSYPALYDYIRSKSSNHNYFEELSTAIAIRNENNICEFKSSMEELEATVNNGNICALGIALNNIRTISHDIMQFNKSDIDVGSISIGLSPSISLKIPQIDRKKKQIHLAFVKELVDFGVVKRRLINL